MQDSTIELEVDGSAASQSDWPAILWVGSTWLIMMLLAVNFMLLYGSRIPIAEDWVMVAPLAGKEFHLFQWAWSQINEHRIPLPRLLYLILLQLTNGDFRIGGFFNIGLLGALSLGMIWTARGLRGGRTQIVDAFFPLAFLHLGHSANLLMGWQITQVFPTVLIGLILLLFVGQKTFATPTVALVSGVCLISLPLCGANGLLYVPFLVGWLSYCAILHGRANKSQRWISGVLLLGSAITLSLSVLYFVNYQKAYWNPPSPSLRASLITGFKLLAFGWGPVASRAWLLFSVLSLGIILVGLTIAMLGIQQTKGLERHRAIGLFLFFSNLILFSLALGHGRAGSVPKWGLPTRYVLFSVPVLCAIFFIAELYSRPKTRLILQRGLLVVMLLLLPANTIAGFYGFANWYRESAVGIERAILSGQPVSNLVPQVKTKYSGFIPHFMSDATLINHMTSLHDAGIEPFTRMTVGSPKAINP